jgi:hypothetical protein
MVNPLIYRRLARTFEPPHHDQWFIKATFVFDEHYHLATDGFWLIADESCDSVDIHAHDNLILLERLVQHMRFTSKQFMLEPQISYLSGKNYILDELPGIEIPDIDEECTTQAYHLQISITREDLSTVSHCNLAEPPPSYDTMLLGAMQAVQQHNYGWAIVLSGVAIEHIARMQLVSAAQMRPGIIPPKTIHDARLGKLLHELRLKASLPSLHCEDPDLYNKALAIYHQRNNILHGNIILDDTDLAFFAVTREAIQCAIQIIKWLGIADSDMYASPLSGKWVTAYIAHYSN